MPKPVTPLVGCDVFVTDDAGRVLLIRRQDDGLWALPGGCQDRGETPAECACREFAEETGFTVRLVKLLGIFSSSRYEYIHYPWKDNEFCHLLFHGMITSGQPRPSHETTAVRFFPADALPPLSDGHTPRLMHAFRALADPTLPPFFE
jgi:8-oxo-dGTP pyrophosphatase MutT (NUDIX family)